jgi:rhomboid protease GluP
MTGEEQVPQSEFNQETIPDEVRANFGQLLHWFTPNIFVCWIILALNVLIFVVMLVSGFNPDKATPAMLMKWGVDYGPATISRGEWWRVVSSCFIHMGFLHVAFNMFVLYQIGPFMERLLGSISFFIVYMVAGVAGAVCSLWWNPYVYSAGASGAIFGLYGALIGFLCLRKDSIPGPVLTSILKSAGIFIAYNAVFGFIRAGTDIAAHVGGLVGGLVCGLIVSTPITEGFAQRRLVRAVAAGFGCAALLFGIASQLPHPIDLERELDKFAAVEEKVITSYNDILRHANTSNDEQVIRRLQTEVMGPWDAERKSLDKIAGLPAEQQKYIAMFQGYMDTRARGWGILVQGLHTNNQALMKQGVELEHQAENQLKSSMGETK